MHVFFHSISLYQEGEIVVMMRGTGQKDAFLWSVKSRIQSSFYCDQEVYLQAVASFTTRTVLQFMQSSIQEDN